MDYIFEKIIPRFLYKGIVSGYQPYGNGRTNFTYAVNVENAPVKRYILQRINGQVYKDPVPVMKNIEKVAAYLAGKVSSSGGDARRECLTLIPASDGLLYHRDDNGDYWRSYNFIGNALCYDKAEKPEHVYEMGKAFGRFLRMLDEYPVNSLNITIPDFRNTKKRFDNLISTVEADIKNRAASASKEISQAMKFKEDIDLLNRLKNEGILPVRVTHNDTKIDNVLLDINSEHAVCVLDLDTVMPGLAAYDYADAVRSCANAAQEDERDLSKVYMDDRLFDSFTRGYLSECGFILTKKEAGTFPAAVIIITYELAITYLTDYINGDKHFKINRPLHNLERAKNQLKLLSDMEYKQLWMESTVRRTIGQTG